MKPSLINSTAISSTALRPAVDLPVITPVHHIGATQEGGSGNDFMWGTAGNDVMYGNAGNDQFHLGGGNDKAYGGSGNDFFDIANGNHQASGGTGDDLFYVWGVGNHRLTGGAGADRYALLDDFQGHMTITDFNGAEGDHIKFGKPVVSVGWNGDHSGIDFTFTDGSSASVLGADANIYHYVDFL